MTIGFPAFLILVLFLAFCLFRIVDFVSRKLLYNGLKLQREDFEAAFIAWREEGREDPSWFLNWDDDAAVSDRGFGELCAIRFETLLIEIKGRA